MGVSDQVSTPDIQDLWERYRLAVKDAEITDQEEISRNLTAIIESNSNLLWDKLDLNRYTPQLCCDWELHSGQSRIMVVAWTGDFYNDKVGKSIKVDRYVWVTVAPELRNFCNNYQTESPDIL